MTQINESFNSSIIRRLHSVNTTDHVDVTGKPAKALSKSGMAFLLRMPILWDRITDNNITIYSDADIVDATPKSSMSTHYDKTKGKEVVDTDEKGNPKYTTQITGRKYSGNEYRYNLGATLDNYEDDRWVEEQLSKLGSAITRLQNRFETQKACAKAKGDRDEVYECDDKIETCKKLRNVNGGLLHNYRNESHGKQSPSTIKKLISSIGDYSFIEEYMSKDMYEALVNLIKAYTEPCEIYDKEMQKYQEDKERFKNGEISVEPKIPVFNGGPLSLKDVIRTRTDEFSKYDTLEERVFPTTKEYISEIIPETQEIANLLEKDNVQYKALVNGLNILATNGNKVLDQRSIGTINAKICSKYGRYLYEKTDLSRDERQERVREMQRVLKQYQNGRGGNVNTGADSAYAVFRDLYRNAKTIGTDQEGSVLNNLEDKVFQMNDNEEFKIIILADKHFGIHYILSYYLPSAATFMLMKSPDNGVLYGWKRGDSIGDVTRSFKKPEETGIKMAPEYIVNGVDTYDSYSRYSIESIKRDKSITTAIIIGGDARCVNDNSAVGSRYTLFGKYGDAVKRDFYKMAYDEEGKKVFIGNYDGNTSYSPNAIEKALKKHATPFERRGDKFYIDAASEGASKAIIAGIKEALGGSDIDYKKIVAGLTDVDNYTTLFQAFEIPSSITSAKFKEIYKDVVIGGDFGLDEKTVNACMSNVTLSTIKKYSDAFGKVIGYGSISNKYFVPDTAVDIDNSGMDYGLEVGVDDNANYGIEISKLDVDETGVPDTQTFDKLFFAEYLEVTDDPEYEKLSREYDAGYGRLMDITQKGKRYKKASKNLREQFKVMADKLRCEIVDKMVSEGSCMTVLKFTMESVKDKVEELNNYLTSRCPYIVLAFDASTDSGTLRQQFYGNTAIKASRTGITNAHQMQRMKDAEAETKELQEINKEYQKAFNSTRKAFQVRLTPSISSINTNIKTYLGELEKNGYKWNLPASFNGYGFFAGGEKGKDSLFETAIYDLLDSIGAKLLTDRMDAETVDEIYLEFGQFVRKMLSLVKSISGVNGQYIDEQVAEKIKQIYNTYYLFIDEMNDRYNLGLKKRI